MQENKNTSQDTTVSIDLNEKAREILKRAEENGAEHSFMFVTAFRRYLELIAHLKELEECIKGDGMIVTKEYVKGRKNVYINPAVAAYNQTAGAADKTAQLLMKCIVAPLSGGGDTGDEFDCF